MARARRSHIQSPRGRAARYPWLRAAVAATGCLGAVATGLVAGASPAAAAASIGHVPVTVASFRETVAVAATLECSTPDCVATLYFRTTDAGGQDLAALPPLSAYTATVMTTELVTSSDGHVVLSAHGTIPSSATDTRGVDYAISVSDAASTTWFPAAPDAAFDDFLVAQHVHVLEPMHLGHVPAAVSYLYEPIHVVAEATCATATCSASLRYRTSVGLASFEGTVTNVGDGVNGEGFTAVAMISRVVQNLGAAGQLLEFSADIPAEAVDTNGVDYFIDATDAYTESYWPGTSYTGSQIPVYGVGAWHHVEVLTRPLAAHVPPAYYVPGEAMPVSAEVTSSTGFPTVTLLYRTGTHDGFVHVPMTVRQTPVRRPEGNVYTATGAIPGAYTAQGGLMVYAIAVDDGYQTTYLPVTAGYVDSNLGFVVAGQSVPL